MLSYLAGQVQQAFGAPMCMVLSLSAVGLALAYALLARPSLRILTGQDFVDGARGFLLALLAVTALLSVQNYRATDYYRYGSYLNAYEFFHYYLGSKYQGELGSTRLYAAALVADDETGLKWKHASGTIRELATGGYVKAEDVLKNREVVKQRFSPGRWEAFKKDVVWFKNRMVASRWAGVLRDKGYNGTPVWGMVVGTLFTNRVSTGTDAGMMCLALLDPLLILLAFCAVAWAFGPRAALFMIILLGTSYMMKWWHMKGALLRTDYAVCMLLCACFLKKRWYATAGVFLAWSALSRIFPAVLLFGPGVRLMMQAMRLGVVELRPRLQSLMERRVTAKGRRFARIGAAFGAAFLVWCACRFLLLALLPWLASPDRSMLSLLLPAGLGLAGKGTALVGASVLAVLGGALGVLSAWGLWTRRIDRRWLSFFAAFGVTVGSLAAASGLWWRGSDVWSEYTRKIAEHNKGISEWRVGFKYVFMAQWQKTARPAAQTVQDLAPVLDSARYDQKRPDWWTVQLLVLALSLAGAAGLKDHRAFMLGFVPLFFLVSPTYYYYVMLLLPLLFFAERLDEPQYAVGLVMMFLTGLSGYGLYSVWKQGYPTYYWLSVQVMVMTLYMLVLAFAEGIEGVMRSRQTPRSPEPI
jgi:hypothetical protein